jgi:hypothetical protein
VHLESSGLPIIGDMTYGGEAAERMMLHCAELKFNDERGQEILITAPLDEAFVGLFRKIDLTIPASRGRAGILSP